MSKRKKNLTRREFISKGIQSIGLVGLGGTIGLGVSRFIDNTPDKSSSQIKDLSNYDLDYDLSEFYKVDKSLIQYKQTGKIESKAQAIHSIAVSPDDNIYVATDKAIQIFGKNNVIRSEIKLNNNPRCLTAIDDNIYVGMRDYVEIYSARGIYKTSWENLGSKAVLTSIAVSEDDVFVADAGNRVVWHYDTSGKLIRGIGKKNQTRNIPGFVVPSPYFDLEVARDGLLRIASPGRHRIEAYTFDGDFEFSWGKPSMRIDGFCGCCNPVNFAMLPDGKFVTCEKGLPRVKIYDADGNFESVVAGPESFAKNWKVCTRNTLSNCRTGGLDVAVNSQGHIMVLDPIEKAVQIFAPIRNG